MPEEKRTDGTMAAAAAEAEVKAQYSAMVRSYSRTAVRKAANAEAYLGDPGFSRNSR